MTTAGPLTAPAPAPPVRWPPSAPMVVAAITLAGFALRAWHLSYPVLDGDEYASVMFAAEPASRILGSDYRAETNPPLYYLLQNLWWSVGESRTILRCLPLLFGVMVIPLTFLLGRRLLGTWEGVVASALVATADLHVFFSREIRTYSLLTAACLGALIGAAEILASRGLLSGPAAPSREGWKPWAAYFGCSLVALYSHSTGVLLPVLASGLVFGLVLARRAPKDLLWRWTAVNVVLLILYVPWILITIEQSRTVLQDWWIPRSSWRWVRSQLMGAYPYPAWAKLVIYPLPLIGIWLLRRRKAELAFLLVFAAGHPLLFFLISLLRPVFYVRPMVWTTVPGLLLLATALVALRPRLGWRGVAAATGLIAVLQLSTLRPYYPASPQTADAAGLVEPLRGFRKEGDAFVIAPVQFAWEFWHETRELHLPRRGAGVTYGDMRPQLAAWFGVTVVPRDRIPACLEGVERVWLVRELQPRFPPAPGNGFEEVLSRLDAWGARQASWDSGNLQLVLVRKR